MKFTLFGIALAALLSMGQVKYAPTVYNICFLTMNLLFVV